MSAKGSVKIWEERLTLPTYQVYPAEKSPLFIEKRAYQGSTGKVYPLPVTEKLSDTLTDVSYQAVCLENEYLFVMVLPQLGGRIHRALDKTNGYDFIYYNHVIKPALVGLTGPWISGGIEFNWPQHHRPSTFSPVDYTLSQNPDGSCSVYLSEIDKMYGTKGMASISLYPGKAYIEINGRLFNNTELPQTFLWWANPAVPVNEHTYSVFPPDVNAVMDHGRRAVSTFPIATGEYYKYDYSAGVDISRYQNIKVPTSYMAAHSDFDFIGNYDEKQGAGLLHVADHHISPGKKQWTWGSGDFGQSWDRNLTDADGPYIELMTGVFTDNQPDFSWLKPYEEKTFTQYFMPYKGVGRVCNATRDAAVGLFPANDQTACVRVYASGCFPGSKITVAKDAQVLFEQEADLSPEGFFEAQFPAPESLCGCSVTVSFQGKALVQYTEAPKKLQPIPEPAEALKQPEELKSTEELYLAALHLEQYRHATYEPGDYYLEGLRRDPSDIRLNNGYGLLLLKRGHIRESIPYFRQAIQKQSWKNPNPYHGECYFNLGLALELLWSVEHAQDKSDGGGFVFLEEAYDAYYKASWSAETQSSAFFRLSCLSMRQKDAQSALSFVNQSLVRNWHNMKARTLKAALLRRLGRDNSSLLEESLQIDPLYMGCLFEKALFGKQPWELSQKKEELVPWREKMREEAHNYLELSLLYSGAGLYPEAITVLEACKASSPMVSYYLGCFYDLNGEKEAALCSFEKAESLPPDYCFPNRLEEIAILKTAIRTLPCAPMAHYYLGNLFYDKKQYEKAAAHWEQAVSQKEALPMALRNLSIAYYNKQHAPQKALASLKKALSLDPDYPRLLLEHDQLCAKCHIPFEERLRFLEQRLKLTAQRDDLYLRYITLLNCAGRWEEALSALCSHRFHPWEGGEGKVSAQYRYALISLAIRALAQNDGQTALSFLERSLTYPENLGEGKLPNVHDNQSHYYMGLALEQLGQKEKAAHYWQLAASGSRKPEPVLYYNDQPSDYIFYQGLAQVRLGNPTEAASSFHMLISYGEQHIFDQISYDFFAVSLPEIEVYQDNPKLRNTQYCNYLRALGSLGLAALGEQEKKKEASSLLQELLTRQDDHQGALFLLPLLS